MIEFDDIEDIEVCLEPLNHRAFWEAVTTFDLTVQSRAHCDKLIASGKFDADVILRGLKDLAVTELRLKLDLKHRIYEPPVAKYLASIHWSDPSAKRRTQSQWPFWASRLNAP